MAYVIGNDCIACGTCIDLLIKFIRRVVRLAFLCFMSEQLLLAFSFLTAKFMMVLVNGGMQLFKIRGI